MNKIYALILPILGIASATFAMDNNNNNLDFKKDIICLNGQRVTRANVLNLLEPAPADAVHALAQFEAQHPGLIEQTANFNHATVKQDLHAINKRVREENIENQSKSSLVVQLNDKYILKMSTSLHKLFIASARKNGIGNGWNKCANEYAKDINLDELKPDQSTGHITDQTTSRAINAALFLSAVKEFQNPCVSTPQTWLLPINPHVNHTFASDATHVVIQENYGKSKFTRVKQNTSQETATNVSRISDEAIKEYFDVIIKVGLFDTASNLFIDEAGNLMNDDLEQPNDEPFILEQDGELYKQYATQRGHTKTDWNRFEGAKKFHELCSLQPRQKAILEECIKTSPVMKMVAPKGQELIRGLIK